MHLSIKIIMAYFQRLISCIFVLFLLSLAFACEARVLLDENNANDQGFVRVNGAHFELNGSPFLFNGFNSYWLMHVAAEPSERYKVSEVLREASSAGLSVCRTWAFSDGGDRALQISPGVYDERVFQVVHLFVSFHMTLTNTFLYLKTLYTNIELLPIMLYVFKMTF